MNAPIMLSDRNTKFWAPDQNVINTICEKIPEGASVLEIGPGLVPFPKATTSIDLKDFGKIKCDIADLNEVPLPYADKQFDFIYARHVLEDMYNPMLLCREMSRVGKAGFIETPSPLAEFCRGVDGGSPVWRGYNHHRYFVWPRSGKLFFLGKFPCVEYVNIQQAEEWTYHLALGKGSDYWNSRFYWEGSIDYKHVQCPQDYVLPGDYQRVITVAITDWLKEHKEAQSKPCFWRK